MRPSPALVVALIALVVSLGGAGYAAFTVPAGSVGTLQLQNGAVSSQKIAPGAVGAVRINRNSVQARVLGNCLTGAAAISAIDSHGGVTCLSTRPQEVDGSSGPPVPLGIGPTVLGGLSLSGRLPELVFASPYVQVVGSAGSDQHIDVSCTLAASPLSGYSQTRTADFDLSSTHESESGSIPLVITEPGDSTTVSVTVTCGDSVSGTGAPPTVDVTTEINALQTGGNATETTTNSTTTG